MWILTKAVVLVNTFITKGTASICYFPSKELIKIVTLSTFGALLNTKVIQSAPKNAWKNKRCRSGIASDLNEFFNCFLHVVKFRIQNIFYCTKNVRNVIT